MKLNPGDAIPTGVLIAYGIYHYPISVQPEYAIESYDSMTNDAGESFKVTLATDKIYDRELCEYGIDNRKLASNHTTNTTSKMPLDFIIYAPETT